MELNTKDRHLFNEILDCLKIIYRREKEKKVLLRKAKPTAYQITGFKSELDGTNLYFRQLWKRSQDFKQNELKKQPTWLHNRKLCGTELTRINREFEIWASKRKKKKD